MKKLSKIAYNATLGLLVTVAVLVVLSAFPIEGMYQIKVVQSGSMEPTIKTGSVVVIKPQKSYKIGDVITFESTFRDQRGKSLPITHRIAEIRVEEGLPIYMTKGDANEDVDSRDVRHQDVIGSVAISLPYAGYVVESARTPYGFLALVVVPAAMVIWDQGMNIWREVKKNKKQKTKTANSHSEV